MGDIITNDITASYDNVVDSIQQLARKHIPVINTNKHPTRTPVPYWTAECTAAVKERNKARNKMTRSYDVADCHTYYRLKELAKKQ